MASAAVCFVCGVKADKRCTYGRCEGWTCSGCRDESGLCVACVESNGSDRPKVSKPWGKDAEELLGRFLDLATAIRSLNPKEGRQLLWYCAKEFMYELGVAAGYTIENDDEGNQTDRAW